MIYDLTLHYDLTILVALIGSGLVVILLVLGFFLSHGKIPNYD
jgi:hypothetical protein